MCRRHLTDRSLKLISVLVSAALLLVAPPAFADFSAPADRYDKVSDSSVSAVATHTIGFTISNLAVPVGSISLLFCSNSPIINDACTAPTGLNLAGATLPSQQGETGFSISPLGSPSRIILTRPAALPTGTPAAYTFQGIVNPSLSGSYYVRIETFTSTDATGQSIEGGGAVFALVGTLDIRTEVPPYLKFCTSVTINNLDCSSANSYLIDLGEFSTSTPSSASSEFVVGTNAASGYSVTMSGTTLTSGNNVIPALSSAAGSAPGTSQFGLNLRANTTPGMGANPIGPGTGGGIQVAYNVPNLFRFQSGDVVVSSPGSSDMQKFTVSYVANISNSQPAGYYVTTLTYICLANF